MSDVKVSVIIPTYNSERWIEECINSVLNQTYKNIEIIVINDGSTDRTKEILDKYKLYQKIKVINQDNSGPAVSRNNGFLYSTGLLIAFLDSDDYWHPEKVERQVKFITDNNYSLILTNIILVDESGNEVSRQRKSIPKSAKDQIIKIFKGEITQNTPTIMMKREVLENIGGFNENLIHREDHFFLMNVASEYGINLLDEYLVYRRVWDNSMSSDYKSVDADANSIVNHFFETRYPFFEISLKKFPFLKKHYNDSLSKYYYKLSHVLFINNFNREAKRYMFKSMKLKQRKKGTLKMAIMLLPKGLRKIVIKKYYRL